MADSRVPPQKPTLTPVRRKTGRETDDDAPGDVVREPPHEKRTGMKAVRHAVIKFATSIVTKNPVRPRVPANAALKDAPVEPAAQAKTALPSPESVLRAKTLVQECKWTVEQDMTNVSMTMAEFDELVRAVDFCERHAVEGVSDHQLRVLSSVFEEFQRMLNATRASALGLSAPTLSYMCGSFSTAKASNLLAFAQKEIYETERRRREEQALAPFQTALRNVFNAQSDADMAEQLLASAVVFEKVVPAANVLRAEASVSRWITALILEVVKGVPNGDLQRVRNLLENGVLAEFKHKTPEVRYADPLSAAIDAALPSPESVLRVKNIVAISESVESIESQALLMTTADFQDVVWAVDFCTAHPNDGCSKAQRERLVQIVDHVDACVRRDLSWAPTLHATALKKMLEGLAGATSYMHLKSQEILEAERGQRAEKAVARFQGALRDAFREPNDAQATQLLRVSAAEFVKSFSEFVALGCFSDLDEKMKWIRGAMEPVQKVDLQRMKDLLDGGALQGFKEGSDGWRYGAQLSAAVGAALQNS